MATPTDTITLPTVQHRTIRRTCRICCQQFTENHEKACIYHPERCIICYEASVHASMLLTCHISMYLDQLYRGDCPEMVASRWEGWECDSQLLFMLWRWHRGSWLLLLEAYHVWRVRTDHAPEAWHGSWCLTRVMTYHQRFDVGLDYMLGLAWE